MHKRKALIFIYGPTGVGKSEYAIALGQNLAVEIINCDVGQFYTPLSIGTAKPDWKNEKVPHHLFDIVDEPRDYTVVDYKKALLATCEDIWKRGATPVVVGGSGFYLKSLFFPPCQALPEHALGTHERYKERSTQELWDELLKNDAERAQAIHPHDRYRIERSLTLLSLNRAVSCFQPDYTDLGVPVLLLCLSRSRNELYERINERTKKMLQAGWAEEVAELQKSSWAPFLKRKKLIGYDVIINALDQQNAYEELAEPIAQKTRQYAKRQMTFWRLLQKSLTPHLKNPNVIKEVCITESPESLRAYKEIVETFLKK